MPNDQNSLVKQADRDAAANLLIAKSRNTVIERNAYEIRQGENDAHHWVQAFARHRIAFSQPVGVDEEAVARIIDPGTWYVLDGYLAQTVRKYRGENIGYDPSAFKDAASLSKARAILSLLSPHNEGDSPVLKGGSDG